MTCRVRASGSGISRNPQIIMLISEDWHPDFLILSNNVTHAAHEITTPLKCMVLSGFELQSSST